MTEKDSPKPTAKNKEMLEDLLPRIYSKFSPRSRCF
jgi:hypothetical protein